MVRAHRPSAVALAVGLWALVASAEPGAEATPSTKRRAPERYQVATEHVSTRAGAARVHVAAPVSEVRKVVADFKSYAKLIPKFEKAKVVGRHGNATDVYLQVPILNGAAKVWAVVRFEPFRTIEGEERLEGRMREGNLRRLDARWRLEKIDEANTQLSLELLIVPKLPVPGSVLTKQAAYAADEAVRGCRSRAENDWARRKRK